MTYSLRTISPLALLIFAMGAQSAERGTTAEDLLHRETAIHWPKAFDPSRAYLFSHNELLIHADCHRVFARFADAVDWPNWFVLTKDVKSSGPEKSVRHDTLLRLNIFGTPITTRVDEFVLDSRLSWLPKGLDEPEPSHYHNWYFVPQAEGCRVVTEETGIGAGDMKAAKEGSNFMHRAHDLWLASLKWAAEP